MSSTKPSWVYLLARRCARAEETGSAGHPRTDNATPTNGLVPTPSRFRKPSPDPSLAAFDSKSTSRTRDSEVLNLRPYPAPRDTNNADAVRASTMIAARKHRRAAQACLRAHETLPTSPRSILYSDSNYYAIKSKKLGFLGRQIRKLPAEIRIMVFTRCLQADQHPEGLPGASKFLSAFQASPRLYKEALEFYYKFNVMSLDTKDINLYLKLKVNIISLVRKLRLCDGLDEDPGIPNRETLTSCIVVSRQLIRATNLTHLEITSNSYFHQAFVLLLYRTGELWRGLTFFSITLTKESVFGELEQQRLDTIFKNTGMKLEPLNDSSVGDAKPSPWNQVWRK